MTEQFDTIIVGAGIAGASLAAQLADTQRVLLLEREARPGMHATGRSAAMFHLTYGGPRLQPLSAVSLRRFHALDPAFWPRPTLSRRGLLMVAGDGCRDELAAHIAQSMGSLEPVDRDAALALFPLLRPERIVAAAFDPTGQDIDVDAFHQGYLRQFCARGGELACNAPLIAAVHEGAGWLIEAGGRVLKAATLVNAAGAWGDQVAALAGVRPIGLQPKRRTAALIEAPPNCGAWPMVIDAAESFYVKPDAGRFLLSPAEETDVEPHDAAADDYALAEGAERMAGYLDWEVRRKPQAWAGLRTFSPDRAPVIGFAGDVPGFFWLVGQGGYGVQTAPAIAELASMLIARKPEAIDPAIDPLVYDPRRFDIPVRPGDAAT